MEDVQIEKTGGLIFVIRYGDHLYYLGRKGLVLYEIDLNKGGSKNLKSVMQLPEPVQKEYLLWKLSL